ncbi:Diphthamide biosynthesis protein 1 [Spraguea lophii 42_110]|uniref:2-(3-amino-3-carboxypropyl)histidine synthase subunit 1 n=1 Tax=Spraguea lophii (strain 42_110) TaxID=1358809 RepID=S7WB22_SPRLO|nr:Diphthamide biosynthesis protein 1 [Spraguea lophii 42_110]
MVKLIHPSSFNSYSTLLPPNYNFEIPKLLRILSKGYKRVALQMPDGILQYAIVITGIIESNFDIDVIVLSDVVYGACCIDDDICEQLNCDILIHFGHSCLIPVNFMKVKVVYIFIEIIFDIEHSIKMIKKVMEKENVTNIAVLGTIQYNGSVQEINKRLNNPIYKIDPLSASEVLGCTSPKVNADIIFFIADGRFHLESLMINNPDKIFYRYCPFNKKIYKEEYDYKKMVNNRKGQIKEFYDSKNIGIIYSILGKQGNPKILKNIVNKLQDKNIYKFYLYEIKSDITSLPYIDAFVQISCTRLSVDWGTSFSKPMINPFEVFWENDEYKMDFYSKEKNELYNNF